MERLPSFKTCFFCGTQNARGLRIAYVHDGPADRVRGCVEPDGSLCGYPGILHGGLQSALLDDVIYWAVTHRFATTSVTVGLTTRFLAPARLGQSFTLWGRVASRDGRKVVGQGGLEDAGGRLLAEAEGTYLLHPRDVFVRDMLPLLDFSECSDGVSSHYRQGAIHETS